jgi:hypothetical protein
VKWYAAIPLALATGLAAAGVTSARAGLVVAAVALAGLLVPRTRFIATVGGVALIMVGCLNVVYGQARHHYLPGSNWAGSFVHAGNLIWLGIVFLLADAVIFSFAFRPDLSTSPVRDPSADPSPTPPSDST